MFRIILAAVDTSSYAHLVLKTAVELAEKFDGRVHLFRAIEIPAEFPAAAANTRDELRSILQVKAREDPDAMAGAHRRVVVEAPVELHGRPWRDVLLRAEALKPDLLVIGSHGYQGWDRILGTNAGAIANHSSFNVLVVHPPASDKRVDRQEEHR